MLPLASEQLSRTIATLYRSESSRVLATLVRLLGDPELAEESMQEAFAAALESWPRFLCRGRVTSNSEPIFIVICRLPFARSHWIGTRN
jgi:DNA-directed RNA polymerase specialized sigma24 family protein